MKKWLKKQCDGLFERLTLYAYDGVKRGLARLRQMGVDDQLRSLQGCGDGVCLEGSVTLLASNQLVLGHHVFLGDGTYIDAEGGVLIGDHTHISPRVFISGARDNFDGGYLPLDDDRRLEGVRVGRYVHIGYGAKVLPGVKIGDGAIIGAGCVVSRNVAQGEIVTATAPNHDRTRDLEHFHRLVETQAVAGASGGALDKISQTKLHGDDPAVRLFFVVTTGRSGSKTLAHLMRTVEGVGAFHEPRPQLIAHATRYAYGEISRAEMREILHDTFVRMGTFDPTLLHFESDQKYSNLIPLLAEILPQAKFVWLARDGRDVVSSCYGRGWYRYGKDVQGTFEATVYPPWRHYRIEGDRCGEMSTKAWESLSPFGKSAWYWGFINRTIDRDLASLPPQRSFFLRLEELNPRDDELMQFLGVRKKVDLIPHSNRASYDVKRFSDWTGQQKMVFDKFCGSMMDRLYPQWRESTAQ